MVARQMVPDLKKDWFHRLLASQPKVDLHKLAASVGVSMESVRKWLRGGGVSRENLSRLLEFFGTDFDILNERTTFPTGLENKWHQLPTRVQMHLMSQIDSQLEFQKNNPLLTSAMFPELEQAHHLYSIPYLADQIANATMTMMMVIDLQSRLLFVNQAVVDAMGDPNLKAADLVGTRKKDWWPLDFELCNAIDREVVEAGEHRDYLFPMHINETDTITTYMRTVPLRDNEGEFAAVIKYIFDLERPLTTLKHAGPVLTRLKSKS